MGLLDYTGRIARASADAVTGLVVALRNGDPVFPAADRLGRLFVRLVQGNALSDAGNPIFVSVVGAPGAATQVEGDIDHDAPDLATSAPVKTGAHANAAPRPPVSSENDRVDHSATLHGQQRVAPSGVRLSDSVAVDAVIDTLAAINALAPGFDNFQGVHDPAASGILTVSGATTGAAVITDVDGTLQQYLRGLVKRASEAANPFISRIVDSAGGAVIGLTTSVAVVTDADGSVAGWLRGLVTLMDRARILGARTASTTYLSNVTNLAVQTATTVVGRKYVISSSQEVNWLEDADPTTTTGQIIPAGGMYGPVEATTTGFRFIAKLATANVSVTQVYP